MDEPTGEGTTVELVTRGATWVVKTTISVKGTDTPVLPPDAMAAIARQVATLTDMARRAAPNNPHDNPPPARKRKVRRRTKGWV